MTPMLLAISLVLTACATSSPPVYSGRSYTRAELGGRSTAELATVFLDPAETLGIERHELLDVPLTTHTLSSIRFYARPRPLAPDICGRDVLSIDLQPVDGTGENRGSTESSVRAGEMRRVTYISLAPGCAPLPERRFALPLYPLTTAEGMAILRALAAVARTAAASEPLPFRLSCVNLGRERDFECPRDLRAALAALPLHQALTIERNPFPWNCDHSSRDEGDAVEIGEPGKGHVWDVRLRHLGSERAEVVMIRQFSRTNVEC